MVRKNNAVITMIHNMNGEKKFWLGFCNSKDRPPNGAIGAMPAEICQKSKQLMKMNGQKKFWLRFCNSQDRTKVELTIANEAWTDCYH